jgi:hypothetical protein
MFDFTIQATDFILNILIIVVAAKWAAQRGSRRSAVVFACAVGVVYSVVSDFSLSYVVSDYDRALSSLTLNAVIGLPIDAAIAYFATRRRRVLAPA